MKKAGLCAAVLLSMFGTAGDHSARAQAQPAAAAPDARVIVKYRADSALLRSQALSAAPAAAGRAERLGQRVGLALRSGAGVSERSHVVIASGIGPQQLAQRLALEPDVEYAVVDQRRRATGVTPNDPLYLPDPVPAAGPAVGQWYLKAPDATFRSAIDAPAAWAVTTGSPDIVVAVLDTGVRFDHEDLKRVADGGNLLPGYDMVSETLTAADGDGRDPDPSDPGDGVTQAELDVVGSPLYHCEPAPTRSSWHGTQVSGLIAALTDNAIGMASVGRNVRVLPVRVLGKCGGYDSDIAAAMRWAAGLPVDGMPANPNPARVINLSLGGDGACSAVYRDAVDAVGAVGTLVVASAGNTAGHGVNAPANCAGVVGVAALRHVGTKVGFSDLGPEIALGAPGGNCVNLAGSCLYPLLTTANSGVLAPVPHSAGGSVYTDGSNASLGTSFAAPLAAGTAALMLSVQPRLTPAELRDTMRATARPFPTTGSDASTPQCTAPRFDANGAPVDQLECYCTTATCGAGMLDTGAAVRAAVVVQARIEVTPAAPQAGTPVTLDAGLSLVGTGNAITTYHWTLLDGGGIVTGFDGSADAPTVALTASAAGAVRVQLSVTDAGGRVSSVERRIDVAAAPVLPVASSGGGGALGWPWLGLLAGALVALRRSRP
jgi:serine protease